MHIFNTVKQISESCEKIVSLKRMFTMDGINISVITEMFSTLVDDTQEVCVDDILPKCSVYDHNNVFVVWTTT